MEPLGADGDYAPTKEEQPTESARDMCLDSNKMPIKHGCAPRAPPPMTPQKAGCAFLFSFLFFGPLVR